MKESIYPETLSFLKRILNAEKAIPSVEVKLSQLQKSFNYKTSISHLKHDFPLKCEAIERTKES